MNFLEALQKAKESDGKLWATPLNFPLPSGITVDIDGQWEGVPKLFPGGETPTIPSADLLFGEWEVLPPKEVLKRSTRQG